MKPGVIKEFITASKGYLEHASPEQKARYLRLLERAQREIEREKPVTLDDIDPDFLEEK